MSAPFEFIVKFIEQYIGEQRAERSALWGSLPCFLISAIYHYSAIEVFVDEGDNRIVLYCSLQYLYHLGVVDGVEETFKVYVHCIVVALADYLRCLYQRFLSSSARSEAVTSIAELTFIDWGQYLGNCLLDYSVYNRWYSKLAFLAVVLRYLNPAEWVRTVGPLANTLCQLLSVLSEIAEQSVAIHFIYPRCSSVALYLFVSSIEVAW